MDDLTATPFDAPHEMEALVAWARKAIEEEALHPLLVVAVFVAAFLATHPFQDGNGRLSRVLTTLLRKRSYLERAKGKGMLRQPHPSILIPAQAAHSGDFAAMRLLLSHLAVR